MMNKHHPTVRFAPSPTGFFHIGIARTALFNYFFAQKNKAKYVVRFEDTDTERSKREFEQDIYEGLAWLGVTYEEEYRQSERGELYTQEIERLLESGVAYVSRETEGEREEVIRFNNPGGEVSFEDEIRGTVTFDVSELGNFVIARSKSEPLYHLAVVIDDIAMGVTHVIRGEDHISNTPRQLLILEALGGARPVYAHIPMILAPDRSKMSKRYGAVSVSEYRNLGFLPEALVNYLALLGWNPGTDEEVLSTGEIVEQFDLSRIQRSGAVFSIEKLRWFNEQHLKARPFDVQQAGLVEFLNERSGAIERTKELSRHIQENAALAHTVLERISVYSDAEKLLGEGEYDFVFERPEIEVDKLVWKDTSESVTASHLDYIRSVIEGMDQDALSPEEIKSEIWDYATEKGRGEVLWPLRYTLSGKERSPDPFTLGAILGKEETVARIDNARAALAS